MNQPPQTGKQTDNRIVSKGRYVVNLGKMVTLSALSVGLLLVASLSALLMLLYVSILHDGRNTDFGSPQEAPPLILGFGAVALIGYFLGWRTLRRLSKVETGVPLTRANTGYLPAPDSLVRASVEPVQASHAILLRAAAESVENRAEQLLRAAGETGR